MAGPPVVYDLKDESQVKEYLKNLGVEYRYSCYSEKSPDGCHRLGVYFETIIKELENAKKVYEKNCKENKFGDSCYRLGNLYYQGKGCKANQAEALECYKRGCDLENGTSCYNTARGFLAENKGEESYRKAVEYFKKGCDAKDGQSCFLLSAIYYKGAYKGIAQDYKNAFKYAMAACDNNHIYGCSNLSALYRNGTGVEKNLNSAEKYKEKAIALQKELQEMQKQVTFS